MITREDLHQVRKKAAGLKAMVIGDVMLDRYIYGVVERISPEAPVPVVTHQSTVVKAGGAANVAMNLFSWGCKTSLVGMIGDDSNGKDLKALLEENQINHYLFSSPGRTTTVKTRVVAASHHLLRIDEEDASYLEGDMETEVSGLIESALNREKPDLIILEDYNKGFLTKNLISGILEYAGKNKVFIAVDPKEYNFMEYKGAHIFKPNLREAIQAAHRDLEPEDLRGISLEWKERLKHDLVAITLGGKGIFLQNGQGAEIVPPLRPIDVVDVCGAGDAVICALALAQISGLDLKKSGALANLTGAYVCSHSGVVNIDPVELEGLI